VRAADGRHPVELDLLAGLDVVGIARGIAAGRDRALGGRRDRRGHGMGDDDVDQEPGRDVLRARDQQEKRQETHGRSIAHSAPVLPVCDACPREALGV
jgi:hypothetical protein